jgi:uncharacterized protein (TIGR00255 family)
MRSMTGYGKGEAAQGSLKACVEIQAINRKQIDLALTLPKGLQVLEPRIRETLLSAVSRGRLNVTISFHQPAETLAATAIDVSLARTYAAAMLALRDELGLCGEVTLEAVLRAPGVLGAQPSIPDPEGAWEPLSRALNSAVSELVLMRETEGKNLASDLSARLARIQTLAQGIALRAPEIQRIYRNQLLLRLQAAGAEFPVDDERILRELALYADKSDITEELTRLESHFKQFSSLLLARDPVGRTLEFLTQEIARELNTLSVKSNDSETSQRVVEAKAELERIREQIQNIE